MEAKVEALASEVSRLHRVVAGRFLAPDNVIVRPSSFRKPLSATSPYRPVGQLYGQEYSSSNPAPAQHSSARVHHPARSPILRAQYSSEVAEGRDKQQIGSLPFRESPIT
eukprot:scaffold388_cov380-Prasinococcus_capsulatus_cf.AAC.29